jgi:hypothetical protein
MVGFNFFFAPLSIFLDNLRAFIELVPFSMTLVASHGCTHLKLLHHGITVILRRLNFCSSRLERCPLVPHCSCICPSSLPTSLGAISLLA